MIGRAVRRPFLAAGRGWHLALVLWKVSLAAWGISFALAAAGAWFLAASSVELARRPALDEWALLPPVTPSPLVDEGSGGLPAGPLAWLGATFSGEGVRHLPALPSTGPRALAALVVVLLSVLAAGPLALALAAGRIGSPEETVFDSVRRRFLPFLALAAASLAAIVLAYAGLVVGAGVVVDRTLPAFATERWVATATALRWGAFLLVVVAVGRVVGATRARLAVAAPPPLRRALREALAIAGRHPVGLAATGFATLLPALLLLAFGFDSAGFGVAPPAFGPLPTLVVAQLLLVARQFQKVALLAADAEFCHRLAAQPAAQLVQVEVADAAPPRADRRSAWRLLSPRRPPPPSFVVPTTISGWAGPLEAGRPEIAPPSPTEPPADMLGVVLAAAPSLSTPPIGEGGVPDLPPAAEVVAPTAWSAAIDGIDRENEIAAREEARAIERPVDLTGPPSGEGAVPDLPPAAEVVAPTAWPAAIDGVGRENEIAALEEGPALERPVDPTASPTGEGEVPDLPPAAEAVAPTAWSAAIDGIDRENEIAAREEALAIERPVDLTGPPTIPRLTPADEIFVPHEATLAARAEAEATLRPGRRFGLPRLASGSPLAGAREFLARLSRRAGRRFRRSEPAATHWEPLLHDQVPEVPSPSEPRIDVLAASRHREKG